MTLISSYVGFPKFFSVITALTSPPAQKAFPFPVNITNLGLVYSNLFFIPISIYCDNAFKAFYLFSWTDKTPAFYTNLTYVGIEEQKCLKIILIISI